MINRVLLGIEINNRIGADAWGEYEIVIAAPADRNRDGLLLRHSRVLRVGDADVGRSYRGNRMPVLLGRLSWKGCDLPIIELDR